jgi:hypothetical protein
MPRPAPDAASESAGRTVGAPITAAAQPGVINHDASHENVTQ